jgi:hypothetical protein
MREANIPGKRVPSPAKRRLGHTGIPAAAPPMADPGMDMNQQALTQEVFTGMGPRGLIIFRSQRQRVGD